MTTGPGFPHRSILEKKIQPGRITGYKTLVETEVGGEPVVESPLWIGKSIF